MKGHTLWQADIAWPLHRHFTEDKCVVCSLSPWMHGIKGERPAFAPHGIPRH